MEEVDDGDGVLLDTLPAEKILYVNEASVDPLATADGSAETPFGFIADALLRASSGTSILVAPGRYLEELKIPGGVRVLGQLAAGVEQAIARPIVTATSVEFAASAGPGEISRLENFEVHATVNLLPGARVVLENNVLSPALTTINVPLGDTHAGAAVVATEAALRAHNNRMFVPAPDPLDVYSQGFALSKSCALVTDNHLIDFRTPFSLEDRSDATIRFNVIDQGNNGFFIAESHATIVANYARLTPPSAGCVYAAYMTGVSRPEISYNQFFLPITRTRGLNEAGVDSDPWRLVGNAFRLGERDTLVYMNYQEAEAGAHPITSIDELNALDDISELGGNSLSVDPLGQPL